MAASMGAHAHLSDSSARWGCVIQVREMDNRFYEACNTTALLSLEKYGQDGSDLDALPEDARTLLQDKDTLLNAVQVSAV